MKTIRLADYENPKPRPDYKDALETLQHRLSAIQAAYVTQGLRAIIVLDGWDASGKGGIIRRLTAEWDPRFFRVWPIAAPGEEERERHFLYRFWTRLPGRGEVAIFDRSWYGRVLVERVGGLASEAEWRRAYEEINAFEAQQVADGVRIVKLFPHVTAAEQDARLLARLETPWKRWKTGLDDYENRARRADYATAFEDMFARTSRKRARWHVIAGDHKQAARIEALAIVARKLGKGVDTAPPPVDPALAERAEHDLGVKLNAG